jgi:hypothetical protein
MAGPRPSDRRACSGERIHQLPDVFEVSVSDEDRQRRAQRHSTAQACDELHSIALDLHPLTAPMAALPCRQLLVDCFHGEAHAGGDAVDDAR